MRRALLLTVLSVPIALSAQSNRSFSGRITRPGRGAAQLPVVGEWIVLHRVGADAAAPIDSMRTRADGSYAFTYRATGDSNAVYFVSTSRGGVAYFSQPTREPRVRGGAADLVVFDTTSAPIEISIRARHIIVTAPDSAAANRTVIEVYELSNDSTRTRVPGAQQRATFDVPIPLGVGTVTGGQGDISPDAIRADEGRVRVWAPIAPGLKQFSFSYELPVSQSELVVALEGNIPVMEVLIENPNGSAVGADIAEVDPVSVEGRPFKRFLAQNVTGPSTLNISTPRATSTTRNMRVMLVVVSVGAAMLLGLGMAMTQKGPAAFKRSREARPEVLALEVAALDAAYEKLESPTEAQKAEHYLKRAQLKGRLSAALAKRDGLA